MSTTLQSLDVDNSATHPMASVRFDIHNLTLAAWLILAIAIAIKIFADPISHNNYPVFEAAAKHWWTNANAYDTDALGGYCYRYGLSFTVAMIPLSLLPTWLGATVWTWGNMLAVWYAANQFAKNILPVKWSDKEHSLFMILVLLWSSRMIWASQSNPLVLAFVLWAALAIREKRWWLTAFLIAASIHIKVWPIAVGLLMFALWPRQFSWRLILATFVVGLIPFVLHSPGVIIERYGQWISAMFGPMQIRHDYRDAWTILEAMHLQVTNREYTLIQLGAAGLTLMLCLRQKLYGRNERQLLTFLVCIWLVFQLVFGPATERNTFGILAPLAAWAVVATWSHRRYLWLIGFATMLTFVLARSQFEHLVGKYSLVIYAAHPIGVLMFAYWLLIQQQNWLGTRKLVTGNLIACFLLLHSASVFATEPQDAKEVKKLILPGESFLFEERPAFILWPSEGLRSSPQPWVFYAPTLPGLPDEHEKWMHQKFLDAGVAVVGIDVGEGYGSPASRKTFDAFYEEMTTKKGLASKPCLLGRSRGGLWTSAWACDHPDRFSGLAGIYPVFDLQSYPGIEKAAPAYELTPDSLRQQLAKHNPIQKVEALAKANLPVFLIHGDEDKVVPLGDNSQALFHVYEKANKAELIQLEIAKGQGHNYWEGFFRCQALIDFVIAKAKGH